MNLRAVRPLGTFHPRATQDGEAQRRKGQTYVLINELAPSGGEQVVEIMFEDGFWMLATPDDLDAH